MSYRQPPIWQQSPGQYGRFFIRNSVGSAREFDVHDRKTVDAAGHTKIVLRRVSIERASDECGRLNRVHP